MFLTCAVVFVVGSIRDGDLLLAVSSLLFLAACVVFLAGRAEELVNFEELLSGDCLRVLGIPRPTGPLAGAAACVDCTDCA